MEKIIVMAILMVMLLTTGMSALADEVVVGTAPGVPACQELNDKLDWRYQSYLYHQCEEYGVDYFFAIAVIEMESQFNTMAYNKVSCDRGLMQVNRQWVDDFQRMGWITTSLDLFEPKTNIKCGMYLLGEAVAKYGNTERAYAYYNTGNPNVKSNKASREVMRLWEKWRKLYGTDEHL